MQNPHPQDHHLWAKKKNRKVNQQKSFFRRKNATGENILKRYTNPRQHTVFVRKPSGDREKLRKTLEDMMTKMLMVFYMVSLWKCWAKTLSWGSPQEPLFSCLPRDKPRPRIIINNSPAAVENIFLWLCKLSCMEKHEAIIPESSGSSTYLSLRFHTHTSTLRTNSPSVPVSPSPSPPPFPPQG